MRLAVSTGMAVLCGWLALSAAASTVVQLDFEEVVGSAELVFEGEVLAVESRQTAPRRIHTYVRFRVLDVIKGDYADDTLELRYLGGELNGVRMRVTDMEWPEPGDNGLYFVESLQRPTVHPLVGWSQGHYRIETDERGEPRVYTADYRQVTGEADDQDGAVARPDASPPRLDQSAPGGLRVLGVDEPGTAMSVDAFKGMVRDVMERRAQREAAR